MISRGRTIYRSEVVYSGAGDGRGGGDDGEGDGDCGQKGSGRVGCEWWSPWR